MPSVSGKPRKLPLACAETLMRIMLLYGRMTWRVEWDDA